MSLIGRVTQAASTPANATPLAAPQGGPQDQVALSGGDPIARRLAELEAEIQRGKPPGAPTQPSPEFRAAMHTSARTQASIDRSMTDQMALIDRTRSRIDAMTRQTGFDASA